MRNKRKEEREKMRGGKKRIQKKKKKVGRRKGKEEKEGGEGGWTSKCGPPKSLSCPLLALRGPFPLSMRGDLRITGFGYFAFLLDLVILRSSI